MSKRKRKGKTRVGWPKRGGAARKERLIEQTFSALENDAMDEERLRAAVETLGGLLTSRPDLVGIRPKQATARAVLGGLCAVDRAALAGDDWTTRRALRAQDRVMPQLFDEELLDDLIVGLERELGAAEAPQEIEALAVGEHMAEAALAGGDRPSRNPLLMVLLAVVMLDNEDLDAALDALYRTAGSLKSGQLATAEEFWTRWGQLLDTHPQYFAPSQQHFREKCHELLDLVADGGIRWQVPPELTEPWVHAFLEGARATQMRDSAMAGGDVPRELRAIVDDPANAPIFAACGAYLQAELEEAQRAGAARADSLAELSRFWNTFHPVLASVRLSVVQGGALRAIVEPDEGELAVEEGTPS